MNWGLGIMHDTGPEKGVPHNVTLGKLWLIMSHDILFEEWTLLNIVAGENQGGSHWLCVMLYCWWSMFPGPLKGSVCSQCMLVGRNGSDLSTLKRPDSPGRVWPAWKECYADHPHGMENRNCCYVLKRLILLLVGLLWSIGIRHILLVNSIYHVCRWG